MQKTSETIEITFKLYATLGAFLPDGAHRNQINISIPADRSVLGVLEDHNVPLESCHLVLVNGVFIHPEARKDTLLKPGDALAVWPPVAGG